MSLRRILSEYWFGLQERLFPALEEAFGPLAERYQSFVAVLEFVRVDRFLPHFIGLPGRPREDRAALARAFIAKAVFDITTTRALLERLAIDGTLRRLCGWNEVREIPSEATFSRAWRVRRQRLAEPPARGADRAHPARSSDLRDSTAIEGREKPRRSHRAGQAEAQARTTAQGRAAPAQGASPSGASAADDPGADDRRPATRVRCRHQAQRQGAWSRGSATSCISTRPTPGSAAS